MGNDRMFIQLEKNKWVYKVMIDVNPEYINDNELNIMLRNMQTGLDTVKLEERIQLVLYYYKGEELITKNF